LAAPLALNAQMGSMGGMGGMNQRGSSPIPLPLSNNTGAPQPDASGPSPDHSNVVYGEVDGQKLKLDIYMPKKRDQPQPAIVLIHGGSYTGYDKSTMAGMAAVLARAGFVAFAIDYRLLRPKQKKNLWPAQLEDCQRAVRWIRQHAAQYNLDTANIGAWGHSSGGQLAAMLGMTDARDPADPGISSRVQAVVDVDGISNFTIDHDPDGDALWAIFFGGTEAEKPDVWRMASPVYNVNADDPPFLVVHGTRDESVPLHQAQQLVDALKNAGVDAKLLTFDDVHTFESQDNRRALAIASVNFFAAHL
jgi:acetyl esterase/lipase